MVNVRVGIVDDSRSIVESLQQVLTYSRKFSVTVTARSGPELLEKLKKLTQAELPEILITDINMPGMSGIDLVRHIKSIYPGIRCMMLTVFDDDDTLFEAIRAGASGYLLKDETTTVILEHLERLITDDTVPMSPRMARKALDMLANGARPVPGVRFVELEGLSPREKDVLYLLVDGLDYKDIAARLNISPHTVRKHIANVYEKLHISSKAQAIRLVQGQVAEQEKAPGSQYRILLVDDHQIILDSLSMMIGTLGEVVITGKISDPTTVLDFLEQQPVDLIISDISMPKLDGLALGEKVREQFPAIKILMLTVSEAPEQVHKAHQLGIEGYVLKKASKEELTQAIRTIMSGHSFYGQSVAAFV